MKTTRTITRIQIGIIAFACSAALLGMRDPAASQPAAGGVSLMPALHGEALAFDAARARLVLFGGRTEPG